MKEQRVVENCQMKQTSRTILTRIRTTQDNPPQEKEGDKNMSQNEAVYLGEKGEHCLSLIKNKMFMWKLLKSPFLFVMEKQQN